MDKKRDTSVSRYKRAILASRYIWIGRMTSAIVLNHLDVDHPAFRMLVSLLVDEAFREEDAHMSARYLNSLTSLATGRTLAAIERLKEKGLISSDETTERMTIYTVNAEKLCPPSLIIDDDVYINGTAYHVHLTLEKA